MPIGSLPAVPGRRCASPASTILKSRTPDHEEIGLDDGVTVLRQLDLIAQA